MSPAPPGGFPAALPSTDCLAALRRAWGRIGGRSGLTLLALLLGAPLPAQTARAPRTACPDSIVAVPAAAAIAPADQHRARIVRAALSQAEAAAPLDFEVALQMRNFAELQARVARGEIISRAEMAAKYFPLPADYDLVVAWLTAQEIGRAHV